MTKEHLKNMKEKLKKKTEKHGMNFMKMHTLPFTAVKLVLVSVPVALASSRHDDALVLGGVFVGLLFGLGFVVVFWLVGFCGGSACIQHM